MAGNSSGKGCTDRRATEELARAAESEAAKVQGGTLLDPKEAAYRDHGAKPVAREERVGAGNSQEPSLLVLAAGRCAGCLAEHEVSGGVFPVQPGYPRDDVLVLVKDQQELRRRHLIARPRVYIGERPGGPAVLGVGGVEEVDRAVLADRDVLQIGVRLDQRTAGSRALC